MLRRLPLLLAAASAVLAGAAFAQPAAAAEINLRLSHMMGEGAVSEWFETWAKQLEDCSNGKVSVEIFPGTTQLGNVMRQQEQVLNGVVDIAQGLTGTPRGRFPRTSVIDLPFLTENADQATRVLWALYPDYLAEEYKGLKVLALHAHNGGLIMTSDKPVRTMEDLKGLRIRSPSPAVSMMLDHLGAIPQGLPPGDVYESLQRGVIDGTVFPWTSAHAYNLAEVLKYYLDARLYTVSFFFVMNQNSYDSLPDDVRACVDKLSGDTLINQYGEAWNLWDELGLEDAHAHDAVITTLTEEERDQWRAALQPMIEDYLDELESEGVSNAREIYAAAQKYAEQFAPKE
jgi:TRAP-type C4-dicarboxylate transport system substrate-binding protein